MKRVISTLFFSLFLNSIINAQFVTGSAPVQDGTISASEYYSSSSSPWYMCWDNSFLYIALTGGGANEPGIVYFDFNANSAANGGVSTGANGSTTGKGDYGVTPRLPFVSNSRIFFVNNLNGSSGLYAEVNTNSGSGWGSPTVVTSGLGTSSGTNREFKISWAQLQGGSGSKPTAFNWLGTASSTGGFIYNAFPVVNFSGNSTTTPTYYFYQSVTNTSNTGTTNPFSSNFISLSNYNTSFDYTSTLPATLYDISIGKTGSNGILNIKSNISISGNIAVTNGTLDVTGGTGKTINMSGNNQLIKIFNTLGGSITGTDNGVGNDLTLNVQTGNTTIDGDATTNSDHEKKFFGVAVASGSSLILNKGLMVRYGTFNVNGALQINSNGYIQSGVSNNKTASYSGVLSTLIYANGGDYTSTDYEWPLTNAPNNVTIQNAGTNVILNNNKTVNGTLGLTTGKITTSSNTLSLGNAATVSRTSGWVNGNLQRAFTTGTNVSLPFDIGTSSNYLPITITLGAVTVAGSITLNTTSAQHPNYASSGLNNSKYLNRYWTATVSSASFTNAQAQFNYLNADLQNGANELNVKAGRYTGSSWSYPALASVSAYSFTVSGLTNSNFSQSYSAGECAGMVLPTPNSNSPVCQNSTLSLNGTAVSSGANGTVSYGWVGVNGFSANTLSTSINNVQAAAVGSYTLTATDAIGCNASSSVNIAVLTTSTSTTNIAICNGSTYTFNGTNYSTAGTFTVHLTNAVGCDSVATLVLTVKPTSTSTTNISICPSALPYSWNGLNFTGSGTQTAYLINSVGCDSAAILNLTVQYNVMPSISIATSNNTICNGINVTLTSTQQNGGSNPSYQWTKNGANITGATTSTHSYTPNNNDTINCKFTSNLTCLSNVESNLMIQFANVAGIPNGLAFDATGNLYLANGATGVIQKITSSGVVSSFATVNGVPNGLAFDATGNLYLANGATGIIQKITSSGVVSTFATVNGVPNGLAFDAIGNLYSANGATGIIQKITSSGVVSTFATVNGVPIGLAFDATGNLYLANGATGIIQKITSSGVVSTFATVNGVPNELAFDATGNLYLANGATGIIQKITSSGVVSTFATVNGVPNGLVFDAIGNLYSANSAVGTIQKIIPIYQNTVVSNNIFITLKNTSTSTTNVSICPNALPYSWNGSKTAAGTYTATLTNSQGCDSVATLVLTIKATSASTTNTSICSTQLPYMWNGGSYNAAGTYNKTFTNSVGCDSVATLILTVKSTSVSTTNASTCPTALPYLWNGNSYNAAGTYTVHLTNTAGCDSAATLILTVKTVSTSTTNITLCIASLPYVWNGTSYNAAGTYNKNFTNAVGCDSVANLILNTVTTLPAIAGNNAVCVGSSAQLTNAVSSGVWSSISVRATVNNVGLVTGTSAGVATIKYAAVGCTSVTKTIAVNAIPAVPQIAYGTNTVNPQAGAPAGSWCSNRTINLVGIPSGGLWSKTGAISVTNPGGVVTTGPGAGPASLTYSFTNSNGCVSSRTITANIAVCASRGVNIGNEQLANDKDFTMYPNPARTFISLNVETLIGAGSIVVTDLYGKTVKTQPLSMGTNTVDIANLSKGMYFVSTVTSEGKTTKKLVVE